MSREGDATEGGGSSGSEEAQLPDTWTFIPVIFLDTVYNGKIYQHPCPLLVSNAEDVQMIGSTSKKPKKVLCNNFEEESMSL